MPSFGRGSSFGVSGAEGGNERRRFEGDEAFVVNDVNSFILPFLPSFSFVLYLFLFVFLAFVGPLNDMAGHRT
jgi:hypothetical protein